MLGLRNVIWAKNDAQSVANALCESLYDVNNDFNGENGEECISPIASMWGCKSDLEYMRIHLQRRFAGTPNALKNIVENFLMALFDDRECYEQYKYEYINHPTMGVIGVSVSWSYS